MTDPVHRVPTIFHLPSDGPLHPESSVISLAIGMRAHNKTTLSGIVDVSAVLVQKSGVLQSWRTTPLCVKRESCLEEEVILGTKCLGESCFSDQSWQL